MSLTSRLTGEYNPRVVCTDSDSVYAKVPSKEIGLDDGAGDHYKVRFRGFEE